jgi:hypothetical protein
MFIIFRTFIGCISCAIRASALFYLAVVTTGCVAGQSVKLDHEPIELQTANVNIAVSVAVKDERDFILSGDKPSNYIGHYRAGFGNPWNVTTKSGEPLAGVLAADIEEELVNLGFQVAESRSTANKLLEAKIKQWNLDSYINAEIWYEVLVRVMTPEGVRLAESELGDRQEIPGSFWVGPKYAVQKRLPEIYAELIDSMVRDNPEIMTALKAP